MLIQFGHVKNYDYQKELYMPIKASKVLQQHEIILPYDGAAVNSKETLQKVDIFFAEVSYPSTWLWIELWFANMYGTKIICFSKTWAEIAGSLKYVCNDFFEYAGAEDMIQQIEKRVTLAI